MITSFSESFTKNFMLFAGPNFKVWFEQNKSKLLELFTPEVVKEFDCPTVKEMAYSIWEGEFEVE